jgi:hypothetical protein
MFLQFSILNDSTHVALISMSTLRKSLNQSSGLATAGSSFLYANLMACSQAIIQASRSFGCLFRGLTAA